ncbi:ATP-binding protein [Sporomusa sp. KB1]|uniref:ATP-binding protein n=1 Tax=Sporomusa sp. KB1 TaxID=943346 RepID=UPI0011A521AB|nr:ATP-binding protein [Sporomusa sp. KB1]TWH52002.1 signal transduction histidine kinase [Sporomusa sp. KB1]
MYIKDTLMKLTLPFMLRTFFRPELDFRVRLFNLLAMSGIVISLLNVVFSSAIVGDFPMVVINFGSACLAGGLLYYSNTSGQYQRCYLITIIVIFFAGFALLFVAGGGHRSGMPSFFIFSILFTVFMLEGRKMFIVAALEIIFYGLLCLYAYAVPSHIVWFETEEEVIADIVFGFVTVSVILGITMHLSFRLYNIQQRQLEQAREEAIRANQAKSLFLASMSHEIRTPLNIMLGMNEMIVRSRPPAELAGYAARAQDAGRMLLALINDILDVAKIECGKLELVEEAYLTETLVQNLVQLGREQSEKKGLSFAAEATGLPSALWGDSLHLRQIAANLISNAVKYTAAGSVRLSLTGRELPDKSGTLLTIAVADTGQGISPELLPTIFDAFVRSEEACNSKIEGTGLGLAIVRELTERMGGRLAVASEYGQGSTFTVEIPQRYADDSAQGDIEPHPCAQSFVAPQGRILAVDDNEGNLSVLKALLARTLLQLDTVSGGQECLDKARQNQYHAILLDYMMPHMDGIETVSRLRQMNCHTPVIALTADATPGTRQKLLAAGFADYLTKPVSGSCLEQTLLPYLPAELVTLVHADVDGSRTDEMVQQQAQCLLPYDISLTDGLSFVGGNLAQYQAIAGIFLTHTAAIPQLLRNLAAEGDHQSFARTVHSLKSQAGLVGAGELAALARRLEEKCAAGQTAYLEPALPLLIHELNLVCQGLSRFLANASVAAEEPPAAPVPGKAELLAHAAAAIANYQRAASREALTQLLALEGDAERRLLLEQIEMAVDQLNFEEAEGLLQTFRRIEQKGEEACDNER